MTKCTHCGQDHEGGRICTVPDKKGEKVPCVPERERTVPKSKWVKINLKLANFTWPQFNWSVNLEGIVFTRDIINEDGSSNTFDILDELDRNAARAKLLTLGWQIIETTRDNKPWYRAVKHLREPGKPKTEKGPEHSDIGILIAQVVIMEVLGETLNE